MKADVAQVTVSDKIEPSAARRRDSVVIMSRTASTSSAKGDEVPAASKPQPLTCIEDEKQLGLQKAALHHYTAVLQRIPADSLPASERLNNLASLSVKATMTPSHLRGGFEASNSPRKLIDSQLSLASPSFAFGGVANEANLQRSAQFIERIQRARASSPTSRSGGGGGGGDWMDAPREDPLRLNHLEQFLRSIRAKVEDCVVPNDYAVRLYEILSRQYDVKAAISTHSARDVSLRSRLQKRQAGQSLNSKDDGSGEPSDVDEAKRVIMRLRDKMADMQRKIDRQGAVRDKLQGVRNKCIEIKGGLSELRQSTRFQALDLLDFHRDQSAIARPLLGLPLDGPSPPGSPLFSGGGGGFSVVKQNEVEEEIKRMKEKNPLRDPSSCFRFTLEQLLAETTYLLKKNIRPKAVKLRSSDGHSSNASETESDGTADDDIDEMDDDEEDDEDEEFSSSTNNKRRKKKNVKISLRRLAREQAPRTVESGPLSAAGWSVLAKYNKPGAELSLMTQAMEAARLFAGATEAVGVVMAEFHELKASSLSTRREMERLQRELSESQSKLQRYLDKEAEEKKNKKGGGNAPQAAAAAKKAPPPSTPPPKAKPAAKASKAAASSPPGQNVTTSMSPPPMADVIDTVSTDGHEAVNGAQADATADGLQTPSKDDIEARAGAHGPATVTKKPPARSTPLSTKRGPSPAKPSATSADPSCADDDDERRAHHHTKKVLLDNETQTDVFEPESVEAPNDSLDEPSILPSAVNPIVRYLLSEMIATTREAMLPVDEAQAELLESLIVELSVVLFPREFQAASKDHSLSSSNRQRGGGEHVPHGWHPVIEPSATHLRSDVAGTGLASGPLISPRLIGSSEGTRSGSLLPPQGHQGPTGAFVPAFTTSAARQPQVAVLGKSASPVPSATPKTMLSGPAASQGPSPVNQAVSTSAFNSPSPLPQLASPGKPPLSGPPALPSPRPLGSGGQRMLPLSVAALHQQRPSSVASTADSVCGPLIQNTLLVAQRGIGPGRGMLLPEVGSRVGITLSPAAEEGAASAARRLDNVTAPNPVGTLKLLPQQQKTQQPAAGVASSSASAEPELCVVRNALPRVLTRQLEPRDGADEGDQEVDQRTDEVNKANEKLLRRLQLSKELMKHAIGKHLIPPAAAVHVSVASSAPHAASSTKSGHGGQSPIPSRHPILGHQGAVEQQPTVPKQIPFAPAVSFAAPTTSHLP